MSIANRPIHPMVTAQVPGQRTLVREGMTLRQHYAGLVLQGFVVNDRVVVSLKPEELAACAVAAADALIAELEK